LEPETQNAKRGTPCPHPASEQTLLFPARDYVTGERFEIVHCRACRMNRTQPQPSGSQWDAYYPAAYFGASDSKRFSKLVEWLQEVLSSRRVRRIQRLMGGVPGKALDIGCGRGLLLREFQKRGWEVQGTESSDGAAAYAREVLRLPIRIGELADLHFPNEHFDAIMMWHVLEHVPDPQKALAEVAGILKSGGIFFVAVPNFSSLEARWAKDKWFHLDVPRHLNHFTFRTLNQQLAAAGLQVERTSFFAAEYDGFSFVQSALNRIGLRHNLLYNLMRKPGAKLLRDKRTPFWQTVVTLLLAPFLGLLSLPEILVAALCHQGATMSIHARKTKPRQGVGVLTAQGHEAE
jgi:2-polyprenyl-3-methyl-5-hydroxy-6-metoxy-1,4-benzoquinol methylase